MGERSPHRHHLPPARPQLSITSTASIRHPTNSGGTRPPEPSRPPAPSTYCCRGCRSRTVAAGRGGSAAPCSAFSPASRLSSHNKGSEGGRRGAAGPGGGWLGAGQCRLPGRTAVLLLPGEPREGGAGWRWQCVPPPASASPGGAEPCVPRTQPRQPPAVPGDGRWGWWLYGHTGARLHAEPRATPESMGGYGNTHLYPNLCLIPVLQGCPSPGQTSPAEGCPAPRPLLVPLPGRSQQPESPSTAPTVG